MKKIIPLSICLLITICAIFFRNDLIFSQAVQEKNTGCQKELKEFLDKETEEFEKNLRTHLQSKKSTMELIKMANYNYFLYRGKLLNKKENLNLDAKIENFTETEKDLQKCREIIDGYLISASTWQKRMLIGNAERKNTIRLAERIRNINGKLDKMNRDVGMIKGFLKTFADKVPCYVGKCPPN